MVIKSLLAKFQFVASFGFGGSRSCGTSKP